MDIRKINLQPNKLIAIQPEMESKTKSGIVFTENTDDMIVVLDVVNSSAEEFPVGSKVVTHIMDITGLRSEGESYVLLDASKVLGTYENEAE